MVEQPENPHENPLGAGIEQLQGALTVWGTLYQIVQTYLSFDVFTGTSGSSMSQSHAKSYMVACIIQLLVYVVATWRASYLLENVWRPDTIGYVRKVLWLAGPGSIVFTWIVQVSLGWHWPATPAASLKLVATLSNVQMSTSVLTLAALAQALCLAAVWNRFLDRSGRVRQLFSDPDGQDWRVYFRSLHAEFRQKHADEKRRARSLERS